MNKTENILTHVIGRESKIVVRRGKDVKSDDFFFSQYKQAIGVAKKIVENSSLDEETVQLENINNIISFIGDRGSGKTSCMLTFANILVEGSDVDELSISSNSKNATNCSNGFYQLPAIDPSFFNDDYNIIGAFIANIYKVFKSVSEKKQISNGSLQDFYKALTDTQRSFGRLSASNKDEADDMERLEQLSCSMKLKEDIRNLTKQFLNCVDSVKNTLVVCIDDIDLNTKTAVDMLEWIRKYLIQPNILVLFAVKLDQLVDLKRLKLVEEYKSLLDKDRMDESEIDEMTERYMAKLFPLANRIYMPDMESLPNVLYRMSNGEHSIGNDACKPLRDVVVEMIFEKTRFLFYNSVTSTSYVVPRNLREALLLMRMLVDMPSITGKTNPDGTNDEIRSKVLQTNQQVFKEYLFHECTFKYLNGVSRKYIEELLDVADAKYFNSKIIYILKKKFFDPGTGIKLTIEKSKEQGIDNGDDEDFEVPVEQFEKAVDDILNNKNLAYNVSAGDVLWVINWLNDMQRTKEESYFLFFVKCVYSLKMYEYYNQIFELDYDHVNKQEEDGSIAYYHPRRELKDITPYHQLIAGHVFNANLVDFIPEGNKKIFTDGLINWKAIKNDKLSKDKTLNDKDYRLVEFFMLCSGGNDSTHNTLRLKSRVSYAFTFGLGTQKTRFDLFSFFYNVTNIKACYHRFDSLLGEKNIEKILSSKETLWADLYKVAYDSSQYENPTKMISSIRDEEVNCKDDFDRLFNDRKNIAVKIDDKTNIHLLLSWSCIRSVEVYQDFANYIYGNRHKYKTSNVADKVADFFEIVMLYKQATHDFIDNDENKTRHYKLNFSFVGVVLKLFESELIRDDFNKYVISSVEKRLMRSTTKPKSRSRKAVKDESASVKDEVDLYIESVFNGASYLGKKGLIERINNTNAKEETKAILCTDVLKSDSKNFKRDNLRDIIELERLIFDISFAEDKQMSLLDEDFGIETTKEDGLKTDVKTNLMEGVGEDYSK